MLIDLDGVLRLWDPEREAAVERRHSLPAGSILRAAFGDGSMLHEAVTGRITDEQWRTDAATRLEDVCGASSRLAIAEWSESPGVVDRGVLTVLRSARGDGWHVGLLTNATTRLRDDLARLGIHDEFDVVLNSSELGICKPDPGIFEEACRQLAVEPEACVFVDDSATNVAAAAAAGLNARRYHDAQTLAQLLGVSTTDAIAHSRAGGGSAGGAWER
ncbi:HAD-IA family hydrolase [Nocardioides ferulae]|uniref:HAD-IA family hydrolase n=1 Tax=Nocardioides ferulae TaxID=2340821 RepID=UPI000F8666B5|nr:HAD-IA family hydrolase [Nocardioides ferulae]